MPKSTAISISTGHHLPPPGTKVVIHIKPDKRKSWDPHGNTGWYTGPAMVHYRCYHIYVTKTRSYRIADTVEFFPSKIPMPKLSSANATQHAAQDLISALQNPSPAAPFHPMGDAQLTALRQLATILDTSTTRPRVPTALPGPKKPLPEPKQHAASATLPIPSQSTPDTSLQQLFEAPEDILYNIDRYAKAVIDPIQAKVWNTVNSSQTPTPWKFGATPQPTNLVDSPKVSAAA
jgi:hypothetical protein